MTTCPHCHQLIRQKRSAIPTLVPAVDTATMDRAELFAYLKRTAPLEDVRFWVRHAAMSDPLRAGFIALQSIAETTTTVSRPAFYKQLAHLQALWRRESNARDKANGVPAVGNGYENQDDLQEATA